MHSGRIIFSQLMNFVPRHEFNHCVSRYHGEYHVRNFSCFDQFLCMAFAQLTCRESLRDIETCLRAMQPKLYHAGIRGRVSRSTLADANEKRDWRIYADFAQVLIQIARQLYANEDFGLHLNQTAYALDSTTIDLCLSLFPWASFRQHKGAIKLHTEMDFRGSIPCVIRITHGKVPDVTFLDHVLLEPAAFYIMDRGYMDFARLYRFTKEAAFFVTRAKRNLDYIRQSSHRVDHGTGLRSDQTIVLKGPKTSQIYPDALRRISFFDFEKHRRLVFLTNNFVLPALTIALLFKCRWKIELFFKWIKQNLRIKAFYGTSENAVKTQLWIAISVYVLVAIIKKRLRIERTLNEILQVLSITLFETDELLPLLTHFHLQQEKEQSYSQLILFNLQPDSTDIGYGLYRTRNTEKKVRRT